MSAPSGPGDPAFTLWTISATTLRQTVTPQALLGRVSAIRLTVNAGVRPIGAAYW